MIVVKIELVSAVTRKTTEIGRMVIANDGTTGDPTLGDYTVKLGRRGVADTRAIWEKPWKTARVTDYPRLAYSVWALVARALVKLGVK